MIDHILKFMLKCRYIVVLIFLAASLICMLAAQDVSINYNLMDYLPDDSQSTVALDIMDEEYTEGTPNARVMIKDVTIPDSLVYKDKLKAVDGVTNVTWLDDSVNVYQPTEFIAEKTLEDYYKDGCALFTLTIDEDKQEQAIADIRDMLGEKGAVSGSAADTATSITLTAKEIQKIMVIVIILVFIILIFTTTSWFEPVLFLSTIGIAIVLNSGTNLILGEISFVTNSAGSILQLAVSMDYSIFLLHRFAECRQEESNVTKAMITAVKKSFTSIMSSGLTTVIGFAALMVMKFKIGADMGIVMAKAIALSLFAVIVFLPCATLCCYKLIDKTEHKMFIPPFKKLGHVVMKFRAPILLVFVIVTIPAYFAQNQNSFIYGSSGIYGEGTQLGDDTALINEKFGKSNPMVLMVPEGHLATDKKLADELTKIPQITSVTSYAGSVGVQIPTNFGNPNDVAKLLSPNYSRLVLEVGTEVEGDEAFDLVQSIEEVASRYYGESFYLVGQTANSYDLKGVVTEDNRKVNIISIGAIALILLLNFKALVIPVILLAVIESSVWINLSFPYFTDETIFYIGYLIISSIQLGATVDYAILFADRFIENRRSMKAKQAGIQTLTDTSLSIMTSATILTVCGFFLGFMSSNGIIAQLGILVGRGAVLSGIGVLIVLPVLFVVLDPIVHYTTYKADFYSEKKQKKSEKGMTQ